jgi:hypothetical protein
MASKPGTRSSKWTSKCAGTNGKARLALHAGCYRQGHDAVALVCCVSPGSVMLGDEALLPHRTVCIVVQGTFVINTNSFPAALVINSDQTGLPIVPSPQYTRAPKGAVNVSMNGYGDKRQITVTPSKTAVGESLPLQVRS